MSGYAEWNAVTAYATNDVVAYNGTIYIALQNSLNRVPPSNPTFWASSGGGSGVATLNGLTGSVTIASITPSLGVVTAGNDIVLSYLPPPPAGTAFQDLVFFGPGSGVTHSMTTYTPTQSGQYFISYRTTIVSAVGAQITMNSALGDRVQIDFSRVPPGTDTSSFQDTGPIANPPAVIGQRVSVTNATMTSQQLNTGISYRVTVNSQDPSGTSAWDASQTNTFVEVYGPF